MRVHRRSHAAVGCWLALVPTAARGSPSSPAAAGSIITIFGTSAPQTAVFFMTFLVGGGMAVYDSWRVQQCITAGTCAGLLGSAQSRGHVLQRPGPSTPGPSPSRLLRPPKTSPQLIGAFLGTAFELMRLVPLVIFWVKSRFLAGTERAKVTADRPCGGGKSASLVTSLSAGNRLQCSARPCSLPGPARPCLALTPPSRCPAPLLRSSLCAGAPVAKPDDDVRHAHPRSHHRHPAGPGEPEIVAAAARCVGQQSARGAATLPLSGWAAAAADSSGHDACLCQQRPPCAA